MMSSTDRAINGCSSCGSNTTPGSELFGVIPLVGLLILAINDQVLKNLCPGVITGKLSDVAGLMYFPFLLTATLNWLLFFVIRLTGFFTKWQMPFSYYLTRIKLITAIISTGALLAAINLNVSCRDLYLVVIDRIDLLSVFGSPQYVMDPTDCIALLVLPLVWLWGKQRCSKIDDAISNQVSAKTVLSLKRVIFGSWFVVLMLALLVTSCEVSDDPLTYCVEGRWEGDFDFDEHSVEQIQGCTLVTGSLTISDGFNGSQEELDVLGQLTVIQEHVGIMTEHFDDLSAFESLSEIGENLLIVNCENLTAVDGPEQLTRIGGNLTLNSNYDLVSLAGFSSLEHMGGDLFIYENTSLSDGEVDSFLQLLLGIGWNGTFTYN